MSTQDVKISEVESRSREGLEVDLAWFAGVIDGEGNINCGFFSNQLKRSTGSDHNGSYQVFRIDCVVANTHADLIEKATKILSDLQIKFKVHLRERHLDKWKPCFALYITGQKNTVKLLNLVLPYLTAKKEIAKQTILAYEHRLTLARAWNNQYKQNNPLVQDDPVLKGMIQQARQLVQFRPNVHDYSLKASTPMRIKKPSTTLRLTALSAEEIRSSITQQ